MGEYSDPSAAHERAMKLKNEGWGNVKINKRGDRHVVSGVEPAKSGPVKKSFRSPRTASHGLTPSHLREETAHADAVFRSKVLKGEPDVVIDGGRSSVLAKSRDGSLVTSETADVLVEPAPLVHQQVLCKSVFAGGCNCHFSKALSACPECGAGTVEHRGMPSFSEIGVEVTGDERGLRGPRQPLDVKIED